MNAPPTLLRGDEITACEPAGSVRSFDTKPRDDDIPQAAPVPTPRPAGTQRLLSLDVYRRIITVTLAFYGFGLAATASGHLTSDPGSTFWQTVYYNFEHVQWTGCGYWDLIQPSFMFMVGVAMAFSCAKRQRLGHSYGTMLGHAVWRSVALIVLG